MAKNVLESFINVLEKVKGKRREKKLSDYTVLPASYPGALEGGGCCAQAVKGR